MHSAPRDADAAVALGGATLALMLLDATVVMGGVETAWSPVISTLVVLQLVDS